MSAVIVVVVVSAVATVLRALNARAVIFGAVPVDPAFGF